MGLKLQAYTHSVCLEEDWFSSLTQKRRSCRGDMTIHGNWGQHYAGYMIYKHHFFKFSALLMGAVIGYIFQMKPEPLGDASDFSVSGRTSLNPRSNSAPKLCSQSPSFCSLRFGTLLSHLIWQCSGGTQWSGQLEPSLMFLILKPNILVAERYLLPRGGQ